MFALELKRAAACVLALLLFFPAPALVQSAPPSGQTEPSGVAEFNAAIRRYLDVHRRLKTEVPVLAVTSDVREIVEASDTLAAALQRARRNARRGDIFNPGVTRVIIIRMSETLAGVNIDDFILGINDPPTLKRAPRIHMRYPNGSSMATMPTRVLDVLPALPVELEYRLLGRALILRDRDAALIVDYIEEALPRTR